MATVDELLRDLATPAAYPRLPGTVEVRQTHISLVFLAGEHVYKVKKPVDLGFLDFTTLERRRHFCEEEVRLNRRLAPGVYLGVVPVSPGADGRLRVGGEPAVEWAVEMARLPEHRMFARMLERGEIDNALLNTLVELLVPFHAGAATGPGVDEHGSLAAIAAAVEQNFEQLAPFAGDAASASGLRALSSMQLAWLRTRAGEFLARQRGLFAERVAAGRIRDGHGDLHAEHVCFLESGPIVYDCIEFDPALRCLDVASEVAFLAMDLDRRGFPAFARYFVHRYSHASGDGALVELVDFYKDYRAVVRGKVALLTAVDPAADGARREALRRQAMGYLQLAAGYELEPALVLLCGLPGSGKSFLAPHLARPLRAMVLHADVRRKQRAGMATGDSARAGWGQGLYSDEQRRATYRSLLSDACAALAAGRSVVVDASFARREFRAPFLAAAARLGRACCIAHVVAPEDVVRRRLTAPPETRSGSDADVEVYLRAHAEFEAPDEVPAQVVELRSADDAPEEASGRLVDRLIGLASRPPA